MSSDPQEIADRAFAFAVRVVALSQALDEKPGTSRTLANQLLRSGTSIGANLAESKGQSRADYLSKVSIALKEARAAYQTYKNVSTTDTLAWCLLKADKPEEAQTMIRRAMKRKTTDAELHFHAGMIELALKQPEAARKCFNRALSMNPNFHPVRAKQAAEGMAK